jgi:hypothetical protein
MAGSGSRRAPGSSTVSAGRTCAAPARPHLAAPVLHAKAMADAEDEFSGFASMNFIDLDLSFFISTLCDSFQSDPSPSWDPYRSCYLQEQNRELDFESGRTSMPTRNEQLAMLIPTEKRGRESERRRDRRSDMWGPPVRTNEKIGQKPSLL